MDKTIEIPESLYERLGNYAKGFETPAQVIERLADFYDNKDTNFNEQSVSMHSHTDSVPSTPVTRQYGKLEINFFPPDLTQFKAFLLREKQAWVMLYRKDGTRDLHQWNAQRFTEQSDVLGNLRSGYLRGWREKEIIKADVAINKDDLE